MWGCQDDPRQFSMRALFMMLRRMGFKPINKSVPPATSGLDYGLKNRSAPTQGYVYDAAVLVKYCKSKKMFRSSRKGSRQFEEDDAQI